MSNLNDTIAIDLNDTIAIDFKFTRLTVYHHTFQPTFHNRDGTKHHTLQPTFHNRDGTKHLNNKSSPNDVRLSNVNVSFSLLLPTHIVVSFISRYTSFFRQFRGINFSSGEERRSFLQQSPRAIARCQYVTTIT